MTVTKRKLIDPVEIGAIGGRARAQNLSAEERRFASSNAAKARWEKYYREHPEKMEAKQQREEHWATARRGRGRPKRGT
jgi:hypothetical protein